MNYIQRLFDAAALPSGQAPLLPVAAAGGPGASPVLAADQRLGLFPELFAPFSSALSEDPPSPAETTAPKPGAARPAPPAARSLRTDRPAPPAGPRKAPRAETPPPAAPSPPERPRPGPVSPLQRLAESDPLPPLVRSGAAREAMADPPARAHSGGRAESPAPVSRPAANDPAPAPAPGEARSPRPAPSPLAPVPAPSLAEPFRIESSQFQPRPAEEAAARNGSPGRSTPAAAAPDPPPPAPLAARPPLEPVTRDAGSPFARLPEPLAPPPPLAEPDAAASPVVERIVERIREVPTAPPAPPTPITAAGQSVIGPLGQRRATGWQPRQDGV